MKILMYVGNKVVFYSLEKLLLKFFWLSKLENKLKMQNHLLQEELKECYEKLIKEEQSSDDFILVEM